MRTQNTKFEHTHSHQWYIHTGKSDPKDSDGQREYHSQPDLEHVSHQLRNRPIHDGGHTNAEATDAWLDLSYS